MRTYTKRSPDAYRLGLQIIKEMYQHTAGEVFPGGPDTYAAITNRKERASISKDLHATLIRLGILVKEGKKYRFTCDPEERLEDVIKDTERHKYPKSKGFYVFDYPIDGLTDLQLANILYAVENRLLEKGYKREDTGCWYKEVITREYL